MFYIFLFGSSPSVIFWKVGVIQKAVLKCSSPASLVQIFENTLWRIFYFIQKMIYCTTTSLRKKCPYSELFWSAFFPHCPTFGLNTVTVFGPNVAKGGKMRTRITPNTNTLYAVLFKDLTYRCRATILKDITKWILP